MEIKKIFEKKLRLILEKENLHKEKNQKTLNQLCKMFIKMRQSLIKYVKKKFRTKKKSIKFSKKEINKILKN